MSEVAEKLRTYFSYGWYSVILIVWNNTEVHLVLRYMHLLTDSWLTELKTGQMDYDLYHHGYFYLVMEMVYGPYFGLYHET